MRRKSFRPEDALAGRDVIRLPGQENIIDISLGIAVIEGKPSALDLDHDPVSLEETVVVLVQVHHVLADLVCRDRCRLRVY